MILKFGDEVRIVGEEGTDTVAYEVSEVAMGNDLEVCFVNYCGEEKKIGDSGLSVCNCVRKKQVCGR